MVLVVLGLFGTKCYSIFHKIMNTGIYIIRNVVTNDPRDCYIGSRAHRHGFESRWQQHVRMVKKQCHHSIVFQRAWNKYGADAFKFEILEECEPEQCIRREQYYLDLIKPKYNICKIAGSTLGRKFDKITRAKISNSRMGQRLSQETKDKLSKLFSGSNNPMYGKSHTEKTKDKIKEARSKQVFTKDMREKRSESMKGQGNHFYGSKHTVESRRKMSISSSKLSNDDCLKIHDLFTKDVPVKEIASMFGVSVRTIYRVKNSNV